LSSGNPSAGSALMQIAPLIALDLPLKILIWEREHHAFVSYNEASHLAERYGLPTEQAAVLSPSTSSLTTLPSPTTADSAQDWTPDVGV